MQSPISFLGKCLTVLVGAGLSWVTVTNPEVDRVAAQLCGNMRTETIQEMDVPELDGVEVVASTGSVGMIASSSPNEILERTLPSLLNVSSTAGRRESTPGTPRPLIVDKAGLRSVRAPLSAAQEGEPSMEHPKQRPNETQVATLSQNSPELRIQEISEQLKRLGASYLLLEKLPQADGDRYRVRCDLARNDQSLKCCFEATRETPVDAMEEVLEAVQTRSIGGQTKGLSI